MCLSCAGELGELWRKLPDGLLARGREMSVELLKDRHKLLDPDAGFSEDAAVAIHKRSAVEMRPNAHPRTRVLREKFAKRQSFRFVGHVRPPSQVLSRRRILLWSRARG